MSGKLLTAATGSAISFLFGICLLEHLSTYACLCEEYVSTCALVYMCECEDMDIYECVCL